MDSPSFSHDIPFLLLRHSVNKTATTTVGKATPIAMPAFAPIERPFEEGVPSLLGLEESDSAAGAVGSVAAEVDTVVVSIEVVERVFVVVGDVTVDESAVAVMLLGRAVSEESR